MDLIYMNRLFQDGGVLVEPEYDLAFGKDENDFSCTIHSSNHCCEPGFFVYAEGTEYGGIVDDIEVDTEADTVTYSGRTWHGLMQSRIIEPTKAGDTSANGVTLGNVGESILPAGYTRLAWIEATGAQRIDAELLPNQNTRIVMDLQLTATDKTQYAFGCRSAESGAAPYFGLLFRPASTGVRSDYGSTQQSFTQTATTNRVTIDRNKNKTTIGSETVTHTASTFSVGYSMQLFATNDGGVYTWYLYGKGFSVKVYDNDVLIRDYIPCKNASGEVGMYDLVREKFSGSATGTPFVAGDPVLPDAPTAGENLVISGDANACLAYLLQRVGLPSALFTVPEEAAGVQITEYQFDRYTDAYTGIRKMLASAGLRLQITHFDGQVVLSAVPQYDFSQDEEFESELVAFRSKTHYNKVNHLICLGAGEGADRIIVHLYMDENGNVSQTQTFFGVDEYVAAYDKTGSLKTTADEGVTEEDVAADRAEKTADLIEDGTEKLKDMQTSDEISIDFDFDSDNYFVGDIVGSYDGNTGISVAAEITKKIVTIEGGQVKISYKVG